MTLHEQIQGVIDRSGACFGVAVRHIESGEEVMIDADSYYPLASVVKIPILVEAFFQLKAGRFSLTDRWPLRTEDKNLPSGILTFMEDGLTPTVRDLLTLMIIISDNTATDVLIKCLGKEAINQRMRDLGLEHIHLKMTVRELFEDILPSADPTQDLYELDKEVDRQGMPKASRAYQMTPENNVGTPRELTQLLSLIFDGRTPDREGSNQALDILLQQQINERLPRFLPTGTRVAHKTGTLGPFRNDSGIIYVSDTSHVALSVFARCDHEGIPPSPQALWKRIVEIDTAIGEIGLLAYEAYQSA
jgi:beta-lactamase class A